MEHYNYKITDPKTGEYYIGVRTSKDCSAERDSYMGSYTSWEPEDEGRLEKEILGIYPTRVVANSFERRKLIDKLKIKGDPKCMNAHIPALGFHVYGNTHSKKSKRKMSKSHKGKTLKRSTKDKISKNSLVWWDNADDKTIEERNIKISDKVTEYYRKNDHPWKGKTGEKSHMYGKKLSEKTKQKISLNNFNRGRTGAKSIHSKKVKCLINDCCNEREFHSVTECADTHNLSKQTVSYHCRGNTKNQKFRFINKN